SEPTDWDRVIAINLYGVLHTSKAVLPVMAEQGSGVVVNLGLAVGRVGSSGEVVCSAAKGRDHRLHQGARQRAGAPPRESQLRLRADAPDLHDRRPARA